MFHAKGLSSASGTGLISLEEWHEFFQTLSEQDTYMPSTSQACAKALSALEYANKIANTQERSPKPKKQVKTANFWTRVKKLFRKIDSVGTKDGNITKAELIAYFRGNTDAAEKCVQSDWSWSVRSLAVFWQVFSLFVESVLYVCACIRIKDTWTSWMALPQMVKRIPMEIFLSKSFKSVYAKRVFFIQAGLLSLLPKVIIAAAWFALAQVFSLCGRR